MSQPEPPAPPPSSTPPPSPPAPRPTVLERLRATPVTFVLLAINVIVFIVAERNGGTTNTSTLLRFGASERLHVQIGEWWRLVTPMFLHIGLMHLAWNGYGSIGWNTSVERVLGPTRFLLLYLLSGVIGVCASVLGHDTISAGASGALFGVVGAVLVLRRRMMPAWRDFWQDRGVRSILTSIAIWTVLGVTALNMDNFAHGGGFIGGLAVTWLMTTRGRTAQRWAVFAAAFVALLVVTVRPWGTGRFSAADAPGLTHWAAFYSSGPATQRNPARAVKFAEAACALKDPAGCGLLAYAMLSGTGHAVDVPRGVALFAQACQGGDVIACYNLIQLPEGPTGAQRAEAGATLDRLCSGGQQDACGAAGLALTGGSADDRAEGLRRLRAACAAGSAWSCSRVKAVAP